MGTRAKLPVKRAPSQPAARLARALQPPATALSDRQPATHQPRSQPLKAGQLVAARAFLIELAGLVVADGNRSDAELTLLHDVAEAAGVASADVPLFLDFAQRAVELADDARDLLAMSNIDQS